MEAGDFVDGAYRSRVDSTPRTATVTLSRDGHVWQGQSRVAVTVSKRVSVGAGGTILPIHYQITDTSGQRLDTTFGVEFNFALLSGHSRDAYYYIEGVRPEESSLTSVAATPGVLQLSLIHEWFKMAVHLELSRPALVWRLPVETVSNSASGFERVYQASCVLPLWDVELDPGASWAVDLTFELEAAG